MNTQEQDALKVEFVRWYHQQHNEKGLTIEIPSKDINEWWLSKLSQAIQTHEKSLREKVEEMKYSDELLKQAEDNGWTHTTAHREAYNVALHDVICLLSSKEESQ